MKGKLNLKSITWITGIVVLIAFTYLKFDPVNFFQILIPILFGSSFILLGILASGDMNKKVKEHYSRGSKSILGKIEEIRAKQKYQNLREQIASDEKILSLRESLKGFERNYFEMCVIYSSILFAIAFLSTFIDLGSYIDVSNLVIIVFFSFWGLFYFSKMLQAIFIALNIVNLD